MSSSEVEIRHRIGAFVESIQDDQRRSHDLFNYIWAMICVRRGLLRVVREIRTHDGIQVVLEEVRTGRNRVVSRPFELDSDVEGLAVQALARILGEIKVAR
ncbi:MAG: hypothetical protein NVSMB52_04150 [Chloroflexota bacterium]